jgi:hypothetical protein
MTILKVVLIAMHTYFAPLYLRFYYYNAVPFSFAGQILLMALHSHAAHTWKPPPASGIPGKFAFAPVPFMH